MFIGPCIILIVELRETSLMSLALLFHYLMLNMFRTLIHPSSSLRLICCVISWVVLLWYDVCWCYVVVWLGWCGIRMQAYIHPQELATYLLSYFMGCIALVRCVLVLHCGLAGVVWYPYAG